MVTADATTPRAQEAKVPSVPELTPALSEVSRIWGDECSAERLRIERAVMAVACEAPEMLLADVGTHQADARAVAAMCDLLIAHYRASQDIAAAVRDRLTRALEMHQPRKDGDAVN